RAERARLVGAKAGLASASAGDQTRRCAKHPVPKLHGCLMSRIRLARANDQSFLSAREGTGGRQPRWSPTDRIDHPCAHVMSAKPGASRPGALLVDACTP